LRQVAGLEKKVALLGMGGRFEIWNENVLNARRQEEFGEDADTSEEMAGLVI